ncbi:TPA: hypothetical protein ACPDTN_001834 [Pasteurella multocida]
MSNNLELKVTLSALDKATAPFKSIIATNKKLAQSIANPNGYLRAIGGTFNKKTYPDLYIANGNSNIFCNVLN